VRSGTRGLSLPPDPCHTICIGGRGNHPETFHLILYIIMRKIEREMNQAIANLRNWKSDNTTVVSGDNQTEVYLHNNLIAVLGDSFIQLFDGGFRSKTTKSRISAILQENGADDSIFQKNHQWFVTTNGQTVPFINGMILA